MNKLALVNLVFSLGYFLPKPEFEDELPFGIQAAIFAYRSMRRSITAQIASI